MPEVKDLVATINDVEKLKEILTQVDTKGGRAAVEARISELAAEAAAQKIAAEQAAQKDSPEGRNEGDNENNDQ